MVNPICVFEIRGNLTPLGDFRRAFFPSLVLRRNVACVIDKGWLGMPRVAAWKRR